MSKKLILTRRIPISFVRSFTVINKILPIAITPAIKVEIPTNQVKNFKPVTKPLILPNISPKFAEPKARQYYLPYYKFFDRLKMVLKLNHLLQKN